MVKKSVKDRPLVGWREWVRLPELGISRIRAKVDTGARTSALHAFDVEVIERDGVEYVTFNVNPRQHSTSHVVAAEARLIDHRYVRSSAGRRTFRPVIETMVEIQGERWPIELTLIARDRLKFRMLLGREAMQGRLVVDPGRSYIGGKPKLRKKATKTRDAATGKGGK